MLTRPRPRTVALAAAVVVALGVATVTVATVSDPARSAPVATPTSPPPTPLVVSPSRPPSLTLAPTQPASPPPSPPRSTRTLALEPTAAAASPTAAAPSPSSGGSGHPEPDPAVVASTGPDTVIEQLAVDRLLADATGIGRELWPDLDGAPCCPDAALSIDGVTTLTANDTDEVTVVIAWTADTTTRVTTSTWTPAAKNWTPT